MLPQSQQHRNLKMGFCSFDQTLPYTCCLRHLGKILIQFQVRWRPMFEVGMKQLALVIGDQRLDCTCWVSLVCVGNSTSVVGRVLSSTWGLCSLLSASCRREITDFSEFSQFWWLHDCGVPIRIAISLLERKTHLGQSKEKAKEFKNKELWQLYSEVWSEGKCFHALPNFLIQTVPFGEPRAGGNLQCFVCQQPMAPPLPSVTSSLYTELQGRQELETGLPWDFSNS